MKTLVCDILARDQIYSKNWDKTSSPVQCIEKALSDKYELIVIVFGTRTIKQRDAVFELCAVLKRSPHTGQIPILALLPAKHRPLLEKLNLVNVEYAKILTDETGQTGEAEIRNPTATDAIAQHLLDLCPYIEYQPIDQSREIVVCQAYYSRLVISRNRLDQICENPDFKLCSYFQNPKISKP